MGKKQDSIFSRAVGYMRFRYLHSFFGRRMPDEEYIKKMFRYQMNYDLDLEHPRTLNEKLNWLKLYDRNPIYTQMVDKYLAKEYIAGKVGSEYTIPTYGVYDHFDEIDFDDLPEQFVLKTTHDCGGVVICRDKGTFDKKQAGEFLERHLKRKYFYHAREWPYKDVEKKIIAEKFLVDESGVELKDYKIFCFHGRPEYVEVDFNRQIEHKLNPYDFDWNPLYFCDSSPNDYEADISKPEKLDKMKEIAACLSAGIPFLRVDFYSIGQTIYVGELTLYPGGGYIQFQPESVDLKYGKMLKIGKDQ